jgi:succinate dehydrogenase / fumarate reductase cytochrome b subunit
VLSIGHRVSGLALGVGPIFLVWSSAGAFDFVRAFLGSSIGTLLLLSWTISFFFHLCNGIRHLVWDAGYGLELRSIYRSGWGS